MASTPRRGWQEIRVYLSVLAQCTQCSLPSTRNPVSSKPTTSASANFSRTPSRKPCNPSEARAAMAATVPSETGVPNSSASDAAVRALDGNWAT